MDVRGPQPWDDDADPPGLPQRSQVSPNGSMGFGNFSGGSLWIEEGGVIQGKLGLQSQREGPQGQKLDGVEVDIQGQVAVFLLSLGMEHVRGKGTDGS